MERDEHYYETVYQVWRSGYNPDRVSADRCYDDWYAGRDPEYSAKYECRMQEERRQARIDAYEESGGGWE